ncbi:hypothetical protein [Flavobacterium sp.]|uniref:hypothetical protein n=1 Tax=Flavobacterium sp. TaxID=239 RepID=UPI0026163ED9|nr:hypothetical protein [Flavobacterium sp.]
MNTEIIKQKINENENDENFLHDILIDCGKNFTLTKADKENLKDTIYRLCSHSSSTVRSAAIRVLCFYWGMTEYRETAFNIFSNEQEDVETRSHGLMSWANTYRNTNNYEILVTLKNILADTKNDEYIRVTAYTGFFNVSPLEPKDWPDSNFDWDDIEEKINLSLMNEILEKAKIKYN